MSPFASTRLFLTLTAILSLASLAGAEEWKKEITEDGKVSVEYRVSQIEDSAGGKAPLIEYKATLIDSAAFDKCLAVLMDVSNHKVINDDKSSETIRRISETEWILYYELDIPWPMPKTDCVMRMKLSRDTADKSAQFDLVAAPDQAPLQGKKRFRNHRIAYTLKDLGNGKVELGSVGKSAPPFKIPLWMIRANLLKGSSDPLRNIVKLANAGQAKTAGPR